MTALKTKSLESYITTRLGALVLPIPLMYGLWAYSQNVSLLTAVIIMLVIFLLLAAFAWQFRKTLTGTFHRASMHLEALNQEDYNQLSKPIYPDGKVAQFHQQLLEKE